MQLEIKIPKWLNASKLLILALSNFIFWIDILFYLSQYNPSILVVNCAVISGAGLIVGTFFLTVIGFIELIDYLKSLD